MSWVSQMHRAFRRATIIPLPLGAPTPTVSRTPLARADVALPDPFSGGVRFSFHPPIPARRILRTNQTEFADTPTLLAQLTTSREIGVDRPFTRGSAVMYLAPNIARSDIARRPSTRPASMREFEIARDADLAAVARQTQLLSHQADA